MRGFLQSSTDSMMSEPARQPEVLVLGLGGVGTLYAYIAQQGGANVTAACRSNYESVRSRGIDVQSGKLGNHKEWRPTRVVRSAEDNEDVAYDCACAAACVR